MFSENHNPEYIGFEGKKGDVFFKKKGGLINFWCDFQTFWLKGWMCRGIRPMQSFFNFV